MKPLSEKIIPFAYKRKGDALTKEDVAEAVEELKKIGLKRTLYPKYLMITKEDLDKIFGSFEKEKTE